jgi:hypothetical protein
MDQTADTAGLTLRCMNCRNRMGIDGAHILADRRLCCSRCAGQIQTLKVPGFGQVEIVG